MKMDARNDVALQKIKVFDEKIKFFDEKTHFFWEKLKHFGFKTQ